MKLSLSDRSQYTMNATPTLVFLAAQGINLPTRLFVRPSRQNLRDNRAVIVENRHSCIEMLTQHKMYCVPKRLIDEVLLI